MRILHQLADRLERATAMDQVAEPAARAVASAIPAGPIKDALSGTWLGHPLHPLLVAIPIGTLGTVPVLDLLGTRRGASTRRRLVAIGLLAMLPTAAAGLSDWSDTEGAERRVGLVHAGANTVALLAFARSWRARGRGKRGTLSALVGTAAMGAGGWLGGHLVYKLGVGVDTTAFSAGPSDWEAVGDEEATREAGPLAVDADGTTLVVATDDDGRRHVLANRCTHRGAPLAEGSTDGGCITCPWHGSRFRLEDGSVVRGPATVAQPAYEHRISGGRLEVRRDEPSSLRTGSA